ncbi:MAG: extradiol ring-cleavage dioxygenase [Actinomycetia bacterium]|nr:extradiol ring-cleavage dioxygenase [Actinomycetes bacterium]
MAQLVIGVGTSHSPLLTLEGGDWAEWGRSDERSTLLFDEEGVNVTYAERLATVGDAYRDLVSVEQCIESRERASLALDALAKKVADAELDALVILGDDQDEHLLEDNLPSLLVYWGDTIHNESADAPHERPDIVQRWMRGYLEDGPARDYAVATDLAKHLVQTMLDRDIDVATSRALPVAGKAMGHAFSFPLRRIVGGSTPIVPIMVNTYNPPSQPRARRCADYGRAIRAAIDSFDGGRIGVMASGGLSHLLVMTDLDQRVIAAFERHDLDDLAQIPEPVYQSGTSEIKTWIAAAAACHDLSFDLVDYIPAYRTAAGSGVGMGFATWS